MGQQHVKRPLNLGDDLIIRTESLTSSTALQTLNDAGVSFLTASTGAGGRDFRLPTPPRAGAVKEIFFDITGTTAPDAVRVVTNTTAAVFWGTTYNEVSLSATGTTSISAGTPWLRLVARNTTSWAIAAGSTKVFDFGASTGSTGQ